jgi:hypothetical protein
LAAVAVAVTAVLLNCSAIVLLLIGCFSLTGLTLCKPYTEYSLHRVTHCARSFDGLSDTTNPAILYACESIVKLSGSLSVPYGLSLTPYI